MKQSSTDPYKNPIVTQFDDGDFIVERLPLAVDIQAPHKAIHTVMEGETLASIAFKYYKDSGQWMYIADFNSIYHPFDDLHPGQKLVIPV